MNRWPSYDNIYVTIGNNISMWHIHVVIVIMLLASYVYISVEKNNVKGIELDDLLTYWHKLPYPGNDLDCLILLYSYLSPTV